MSSRRGPWFRGRWLLLSVAVSCGPDATFVERVAVIEETCNFKDDNGDGSVDEGFDWRVGSWRDVLVANGISAVRALALSDGRIAIGVAVNDPKDDGGRVVFLGRGFAALGGPYRGPSGIDEVRVKVGPTKSVAIAEGAAGVGLLFEPVSGRPCFAEIPMNLAAAAGSAFSCEVVDPDADTSQQTTDLAGYGSSYYAVGRVGSELHVRRRDASAAWTSKANLAGNATAVNLVASDGALALVRSTSATPGIDIAPLEPEASNPTPIVLKQSLSAHVRTTVSLGNDVLVAYRDAEKLVAGVWAPSGTATVALQSISDGDVGLAADVTLVGGTPVILAARETGGTLFRRRADLLAVPSPASDLQVDGRAVSVVPVNGSPNGGLLVVRIAGGGDPLRVQVARIGCANWRVDPAEAWTGDAGPYVASLKNGEMVFAANYSGGLTLDDSQSTGHAMFLARLDPTGAVLSTRSYPGFAVSALAVTNDDQVAILGIGSKDVPPGCFGGGYFRVAELSLDGACKFMKLVSFNETAIAASGDALVVVGPRPPMTFSDPKNPCAQQVGQSDIFIHEMRPAKGDYDCHRFGTPFGEAPNDVALDPSGDLYVAGFYDRQLPDELRKCLGPPVPEVGPYEGLNDAFIAKLHAKTHECIWARTLGGRGKDAVDAVLALSDGGVVAAGTFGAPTSPAPSDGGPVGSADVFIARYDAGGVLRWLRSLGGPGAQLNPRLGIRPASPDVVFVAFDSRGPVTAGPCAVGESGRDDVIVATLSLEDGSPLCLARADAPGDHALTGLAVTLEGRAAMASLSTSPGSDRTKADILLHVTGVP